VSVVVELKRVTGRRVVATQRQIGNILVLCLARFNIDRRLVTATAIVREHG